MTHPIPIANPNMDTHPAAYIHMVQHLIEQCLVFLMSREECMAALAKHAHVEPLITAVVWDELEKTNKEFFLDYNKRTSNSDHGKLELESVNDTFLSVRGNENMENHG